MSEKETKTSQVDLTPEQEEAIIKAMEQAKMPIVLTDKDFTLGERELDIRKLSKSNREQMLFRMCCHAITYTKAMQENLVDIMKLVMILLKKLGVENIIDATDKLEDDLKAELEEKSKKTN